MNQASVLVLSAVSAVPVLPETGAPGKFLNAVAPVPDVTTPRISPCSAVTTAAGSTLGVGAGEAGAGVVTSEGARHVPLSTVAATIAMSSGLIASWPWPMVADASSAASLGAGTVPWLTLRPPATSHRGRSRTPPSRADHWKACWTRR